MGSDNLNKVYILGGVACVVLLVGLVFILSSGGGGDDAPLLGGGEPAPTNPTNPANPAVPAEPYVPECGWEVTNEVREVCEGNTKLETRKFSCGPVSCQGGACVQGTEEWRPTDRGALDCFGCQQSGEKAICNNEVPPPSGLSVIRETTEAVTIGWEASDRVDSYDVHYCADGTGCDAESNTGWERLAPYGTSATSTHTTEASVGNLTSGKGYKFKIRSVRQDSFLNTSDWALITATTKSIPFVDATVEGPSEEPDAPRPQPTVIRTGG